jgi:hypothetical protein
VRLTAGCLVSRPCAEQGQRSGGTAGGTAQRCGGVASAVAAQDRDGQGLRKLAMALGAVPVRILQRVLGVGGVAEVVQGLDAPVSADVAGPWSDSACPAQPDVPEPGVVERTFLATIVPADFVMARSPLAASADAAEASAAEVVAASTHGKPWRRQRCRDRRSASPGSSAKGHLQGLRQPA